MARAGSRVDYNSGTLIVYGEVIQITSVIYSDKNGNSKE